MKKMRKLIPALAMLLVSAVMMSTASFAWFSMNDNATATGMSVQAKASGNLLISKETMTALTTTIEVDLGSNKVNLTPITYNGDADVWQVPTAGQKVDPLYGVYDAATNGMTPVNAATVGNYFAEYVVYLATAGDAFKGTLNADVAAIAGATENIAPAYAVAFYVVEQAAGGSYADPDWSQPDAYYTYSEYIANGNRKQVKTNVTIPSTYGVNADNKVGTKVIIRVYVDGALEKETIKVDVPTYTSGAGKTYDATTMAGYKFYLATDVNHTNEVSKTMFTQGMALDQYTYWNGTDVTQRDQVVTYVNNTTVPAGATVFEMDFSCTDTTPVTP